MRHYTIKTRPVAAIFAATVAIANSSSAAVYRGVTH